MRRYIHSKAFARHKKHERIQRQSSERVLEAMSADQRKILRLSAEGYAASEIARELALPLDYVSDFMTGLVQRLTHDHLIPSPEWRNVLHWAEAMGCLAV